MPPATMISFELETKESCASITAFIPEPYPDGIGEGIVTDAKGNLYSALTTGQALKKYVKQ